MSFLTVLENIYLYELLTLVFCLVFSALFSGSEVVLIAIGIDRAKQLVEEGGKKGKAMSFLVKYPNELLATILVGNNLVNVFASSVVTIMFSRIFQSDAIGISVGIVTFAILIFGEVLPKAFSRSRAEGIVVGTVYFLKIFYFLFFPVVKLMVYIIKILLRDNSDLSGKLVTKNELEYLVNKAEQEKTIDSKQLDLIASALEFPEIKVKDVMIPRSKINYLQRDWKFEKLSKVIKEDNHSRYPVCEGDIGNTIGFLHVKDLAFLSDSERENFQITTLLKKPFFVYEHMKIQAVFDHMNRKKMHLALAKDENGLVVGVVTLEDIVEEILGEIQDEHDEDIVLNEENSSIDQGSIKVDGSISLRDLDNSYDLKIPLNNNYSTLAGFILDRLGNTFPEKGQVIQWEEFSFELAKVEESFIVDVLIKKISS